MTTTSTDAQAQTMIDNLPDRTGKSLPQWIALLRKTGLSKHGEIVKHLKSGHAVTHGFANLIAAKYRESTTGSQSDDDLIAAQYAGAKSALRPIYDAIIKMVGKLGKDVEVAPKKTYVSLRRSKQFALVQPSTKTRVDLGLNLKGMPADGRLESSGSFNAMVSHRVRLSDIGEVDKELQAWIKKAYDAA